MAEKVIAKARAANARSATSDEQLAIEVPADTAPMRLDRFLATNVQDMSRARVQALIRAGAVALDEHRIRDPAHKIRPGNRLTLKMPETAPHGLTPEAISLNIAYEDDHLIVIDKPAGLVVHPAAGHATGTLVHALLAHCGESLSGIGGVTRPGIVHRLDKDTSGLMVVAKSDSAHRGLSEQFADHGADGRLTRAYTALCWGLPERPRDRIVARLGRHAANRKKIAVVTGERGRYAATRYEVLHSFPGRTIENAVSLVRLELETGRTHQIRVHLAHIGHPVLGDPLYASGFKSSSALLDTPSQEALAHLGRQALHAGELGFVHPDSGNALAFQSELPPDIEALRVALDMQKPTEQRRRRR